MSQGSENARTWELIDLVRPYTANKTRNLHYHTLAKLTKDTRLRFQMLALAAGLPNVATIRVEVTPTSKDRRWRPDVGACYPTVKAAIDGLIDAGVIDDDDDKHLTSLKFYPRQVTGVDSLRLTIIEDLPN